MSFLSNYFNHADAVQRAAAPLGVTASTDHSDFSLRLTDGHRTETWRPKFFASVEGRRMYTDRFGSGVVGFAGWSPYALRQWPIATDKIAFKRYAIAHDIPTPAACFDPALIRGPFLVKQARSSFGEGIRGPFPSYEPRDPEQRLGADEFYENFIVGMIAKAWCWGEECVALNLHKPTVVCGDGESTVRRLVDVLPNSPKGQHDWQLVERLARYAGLGSLDSVVPKGKEVLVEFKYGSRYEEPSYRNTNILRASGDSLLAAQFRRYTQLLSRAVNHPAEFGPSQFTIDAVIDAEGQPHFLEMNCSPATHPDVYVWMARGRFASAAPTMACTSSSPGPALVASDARRRDKPASAPTQRSRQPPRLPDGSRN